jgi:K+-transporting ATPase ATPase C chain
MLKHIRSNLLLAGSTLLFGSVLYPLVILAIGQGLVPDKANGSLIYDGEGRPIGSSLIAQDFKGPQYFHPRPSAADFKADASSGSNYGANNPKLRQRVTDQLQADFPRAEENPVPADLVTTSGSGLDPHISLRGARAQLDRVAAARGIDPQEINALLSQKAFTPLANLAGEPLIHVLDVNMELDRRLPKNK